MRTGRDKLCRTTPALEEMSTIHWRLRENITNSTITCSFQLVEGCNLTGMFLKNFLSDKLKKKISKSQKYEFIFNNNTLVLRYKDILMTGGALLVLMEFKSG